ncbi:MAG TPA: cytochrome C oxidase subunit IV family protein [Anaerolineaceae bacterium]
MQKSPKSIELRRGIVVFVALALLTGLEFLIAQLELTPVLLWILLLLKAGLVLWYFMHINRLWKTEGGDHE